MIRGPAERAPCSGDGDARAGTDASHGRPARDVSRQDSRTVPRADDRLSDPSRSSELRRATSLIPARVSTAASLRPATDPMRHRSARLHQHGARGGFNGQTGSACDAPSVKIEAADNTERGGGREKASARRDCRTGITRTGSGLCSDWLRRANVTTNQSAVKLKPACLIATTHRRCEPVNTQREKKEKQKSQL